MAAGFPLPALDIRPPQQPVDPLASFQKIMSLRSLMGQQQLQQQQLASNQQEQQLRQQQINDQQLTQQYLRDHPGATFADAADGLRGRISVPTYTNLIDLDATVRQKHAQATQAELDNGLKVHTQQQQIYNNAANLSDDDLGKQWGQIATQWNAIPGNPMKLDPNQPINKAQLQQFGTANALQEAYLKQEQDKREAAAKTAESQGKAQEATATAQQKQMESQWYQGAGGAAGAPGVPAEVQQQADWLAKNPGKGPSDFLLWKARNSPTMMMQGNPGAAGDPMVDMVGQGRVDYATATARMSPMSKDAFTKALAAKYPEYSQATYGVAKKEQEAFTSGSQGQQLTAIDTAREHMQTFKDTADALGNGNFLLANRIGQDLGMQFGQDQASNFQIARAAFAGEVGKAFAGASVAEGDRRELLDKINSASSPAQLKGYADTADKLLAGKQAALKRSYQSGMTAQPNFGSNSPGEISATGPNGHKIVVRNGRWVDAQTGAPIQ